MAKLFTVYDSQDLNYPNLTKTSVMSESYQTIGGLFNNNSIKKCKSQTQEMIEDFSLDRNNKDGETDFESSANESNTNSQANTENNSKINSSNSNNINYVNSNNNNNKSNIFNNNNDNDNSNINNNSGNINNTNSNNDLNNFNNNKNNNNNESSNSNNNSESNSSDNENENESTNKFQNPDFSNSMGSYNDIISNSNFANIFNNMSANSVQANNSNEKSAKNSPSSYSRNSESNNSTNLAILKQESKKRVVHSRKSIYDISSFHAHSVQFIDIVIDSINFAFDVLEATEYKNNTTQHSTVELRHWNWNHNWRTSDRRNTWERTDEV